MLTPTPKIATEQAAATRLTMSYEEFLAWSDEDTHAEWVEEEVIVYMPPRYIHQNSAGFLYELLALFARLLNRGEVCVAPFEMRLADSAREPDIFFIATENLGRLSDERLTGPADLIVEMVSASSVKRDRDEKLKEYQAAGVREYWIIDPRSDKRRADFFRLDETGHYTLYATEDDERVESAVLAGFWLRPEWLWQAGRLNPLTLFFEIRGLSPAQSAEIERLLREGGSGNE
jgi:Uma2 family endonuclease